MILAMRERSPCHSTEDGCLALSVECFLQPFDLDIGILSHEFGDSWTKGSLPPIPSSPEIEDWRGDGQ